MKMKIAIASLLLIASATTRADVVSDIKAAMSAAKKKGSYVARIHSSQTIRSAHVSLAVRQLYAAMRPRVTTLIKGTSYKVRWTQHGVASHFTVINEGMKKTGATTITQ